MPPTSPAEHDPARGGLRRRGPDRTRATHLACRARRRPPGGPAVAHGREVVRGRWSPRDRPVRVSPRS
ncbi:hypothetical protein FTX61_19030 [Nitriliruptoraceae bacterium ZYF776]|nr:hypothetical protein [Profundirhabdus halotolerans]